MARFRRVDGIQIPLTAEEEAERDAEEIAVATTEAQRVQDLADGTYAEQNATAGFDGALERPVTYKDLIAFAQAIKDQQPAFDLVQFRTNWIARRKALK